ncbi:MAG: galactokinase [Chloroflexota bacterium]|nr:galactokinase [Chloroflexota bacterium]
MIIVRSPLRITFGGGGTDLPSYYGQHGGFLIAAAIDKYVYITIHDTFDDDLIVKYSKLERVPSAAQIEHPVFRLALALLELDGRALEISSLADIPAGTGLGSSGSFTTALLKALHTFRKHVVHPRELAEQACHIEIDLLHEEIGKQDQYISAFGGLTCFEFRPDGHVEAWPLRISTETLYNLEDNLLLFFTGYSRSASQVLRDQNQRTLRGDADVKRNLDTLKDIACRSQTALERGDLGSFAELLTAQWEHKKQRSASSSNSVIDRWYALGMANGALGGKLVGAGGGGFLMFYAEDKTRLRHTMFQEGLREVRFRFDFEGTKAVV